MSTPIAPQKPSFGPNHDDRGGGYNDQNTPLGNPTDPRSNDVSSGDSSDPRSKKLSPEDIENRENLAKDGATTKVGAAEQVLGTSPGWKNSVTGANSKNAPLGKRLLRFTRKKTVAYIVAGGFTFGGIGVFSIAQGPLKVMEWGNFLQNHLSNQDNGSNSRLGKMLLTARYAGKGDIGRSRLTVNQNRNLTKMQKTLAKNGIAINHGKTGQITTITIDTSKNPRYRGLSNEQAKQLMARDLGIEPKQISGGADGKKGGKLAINAREVSGKAQRAIVIDVVKSQNLGKWATAKQIRIFAKYYNTPSWLHPLKKLGAAGDRAIANTVYSKNKAAEKERKANIIKKSPEAEARAAAVRSKLNTGTNVAGGILLGSTAVCVAKDVAGQIPALNRENVAIPALLSAGDGISLKSQGQAGNDFKLAQYGAVAEGFTDKEGKDVFQSKAYLASKGKPGGTDVSPDVKQAFSPDSSAANIEKEIDSTFPGLCSTAGQVITGVAGGALLFVPGVGFVTKAISLSAGMAAIVAVTTLVPKILADDAITGVPHEGPIGGGIDALGARELANTSYRASGGSELSKRQSAVLRESRDQESRKEFQKKSFASRMFDINDSRSLVSTTLVSGSTLSSQNIARSATNLLNINSWGSRLSSLFVSKTYAAERVAPYDYGFPEYGFSQDDLDNPILEDPVENAEIVSAMLDDPNRTEGIKKKSLECFGVELIDAGQGWGANAVKDVNPASGEYQGANCVDAGNQDWLRIRMFIFDTRVFDGYACLEGDEDSCEVLGLSDSQTPSDAGNATGSEETIGDLKIKKLSPALAGAQDTAFEPKGITLHWWGNQYGKGIDPLVDIFKGNGFSVQLGITSEGEVWQLTDKLTTRTNHAIGGNGTTIGIEIEGGPGQFGKEGIEKYPKKFEAVVKTVQYLKDKYNIPIAKNATCGNASGILQHSDFNNCPEAVGKSDVDDYYYKEVVKRIK